MAFFEIIVALFGLMHGIFLSLTSWQPWSLLWWTAVGSLVRTCNFARKGFCLLIKKAISCNARKTAIFGAFWSQRFCQKKWVKKKVTILVFLSWFWYPQHRQFFVKKRNKYGVIQNFIFSDFSLITLVNVTFSKIDFDNLT